MLRPSLSKYLVFIFNLGPIQSMKERVPRNGVPNFGQKERNGPIVKERNGERNGVPNFKEREERGKFGKFLGEKCKNMRKFSKFKLFLWSMAGL